MSFEEFMGFVTGVLVAIVACAAVMYYLTKKKQSSLMEFDERTTYIRGRASQWSFYISFAGVLVAWIADNVLANSRGEAINFFSPWGIMVWGMIFVFILAQGLSYYLNSSSMLDGESKKLRIIGIVLIASGLLMRVANSEFPFFHYWQLGSLIAGSITLLVYAYQYRMSRS